MGSALVGPSVREADRAHIADRTAQFNRLNPATDQSFLQPHASVCTPLSSGCSAESVLELMRVVTKASALNAAASRRREATVSEVIVEWATGAGAAAVTELVETMPALAAISDQLSARPHSSDAQARHVHY